MSAYVCVHVCLSKSQILTSGPNLLRLILKVFTVDVFLTLDTDQEIKHFTCLLVFSINVLQFFTVPFPANT